MVTVRYEGREGGREERLLGRRRGKGKGGKGGKGDGGKEIQVIFFLSGQKPMVRLNASGHDRMISGGNSVLCGM